MRLESDNRTAAMLCILAGVGLASAQDAVVKYMSSSYPVYETLLFRCLGSLPVVALLLWRETRFKGLMTPLLGRVLLRGLILAAAYLCFVLAIAAMPIATAVAIYFTMPLFVAGLAGPLLHERVRFHRWMAIIAGFIGVLVMVRPGLGVSDLAALLASHSLVLVPLSLLALVHDLFEPASLLAVASAFGYAVGQMLGRPLSQKVPPIIIATWQNFVYAALAVGLLIIFNLFDLSHFSHPSLVFLSRPWVWPPPFDFALLFGHGMLAAIAMVLFVNAYRLAEANFVAPFEYSAIVWAVLYGLILFGHFPDSETLVGAGIVIAAGVMMTWRDRQLDRSRP
jgi:drug/metabolite transporter (DMT)-like permease